MAASSCFRFYQLKIQAKNLPGLGIRVDPLAVVFTGARGSWRELGRTERRANEWNPKFAHTITLPADTDAQKRARLRVDFYNKDVQDDRFLGTCEFSFDALIRAGGSPVEYLLNTPNGSKKPRVFLTALEGVVGGSDEGGNLALSFQIMRTNYIGVSMRIVYEISRAANEQWYPVYTSPPIVIDEQGYGQFGDARVALKDITGGSENADLSISLYRQKIIGRKRFLGYFRFSLKELVRQRTGEHLMFEANTKEDITSAAVQLLYNKKEGVDYVISLKLINVVWKAELLTPEQY